MTEKEIVKMNMLGYWRGVLYHVWNGDAETAKRSAVLVARMGFYLDPSLREESK